MDASGEVAALVDIDDGVGEFSVANRTGDVTIELDKGNHMVLYKRTVKKVGAIDQLSCKKLETNPQ